MREFLGRARGATVNVGNAYALRRAVSTARTQHKRAGGIAYHKRLYHVAHGIGVGLYGLFKLLVNIGPYLNAYRLFAFGRRRITFFVHLSAKI